MKYTHLYNFLYSMYLKKLRFVKIGAQELSPSSSFNFSKRKNTNTHTTPKQTNTNFIVNRIDILTKTINCVNPMFNQMIESKRIKFRMNVTCNDETAMNLPFFFSNGIGRVRRP